MSWEPRDPIYYEKAKQITADYFAMNKDVDAVATKWRLTNRSIRRYIALMGVVLAPRKRDKNGRYTT